MKAYEKLEQWSNQHHAAWMDVLRMMLGLTLVIKGFMFISDTSVLVTVLNDLFGISNGIIWAHVIAIIHLFTGFLIAIGLATRTCCLIDIPLLLGAIFFVNMNTGGTSGGELILSVVVLLLLVFFFIKGSGRVSAFYYLINSKRSRLTDESRRDFKGGSPVPPLDKDANIV